MKKDRKVRKTRKQQEKTAAPTTATVPSVRDGVLRRMRRLLAGSALAGMAAACPPQDGPVVCDPLPPPDGRAMDDGRDDSGPVVCDPLPAPDGRTVGDGDSQDGDAPVVCDPLPWPGPPKDKP